VSKVKQLSVWVESRPAELKRVTQALAAARINITGIACRETTKLRPIRLLVSSATKARNVLSDLGMRVTEEEVLRLTVPDKVGALGDLAERFADANIQVEYAYGVVTQGGKNADIIFAVSDLPGALRALKGSKSS
jgi:hypothetical protein